MNIKEQFVFAKRCLDEAEKKLDEKDYDMALTLAVTGYEQSRGLLEHLWRLRRNAALASSPPGENVQ